MGETDAERMPNLVEQSNLRGVIHCHTTYSDGLGSIEEMTKAAKERGYEYLGLADHSQSAAYAGGLTPEDVVRQHEEIDKVNKKIKGIRVLKGVESDIRTDGSLDYDDDILQSFEFIVASVHSRLSMTQEEATKRVIRAIESPFTTVLGHPTGRLLLSREGYSLDLTKVFDACKANSVAIEINANPHRLDLDWRHLKAAKERGVKLCIGPDAHSVEGFDDMKYGLGIARKGWLEADDLLNCMSVKEFLNWRQSN